MPYTTLNYDVRNPGLLNVIKRFDSDIYGIGYCCSHLDTLERKINFTASRTIVNIAVIVFSRAPPSVLESIDGRPDGLDLGSEL